MNRIRDYGALSTRNRALLRLMRQVNFGRIEELHVRGGQPILDPPPRIIRVIRLDASDVNVLNVDSGNFELKAEHIRLFEQRVLSARLRDCN
jgi:hypothetical protein